MADEKKFVLSMADGTEIEVPESEIIKSRPDLLPKVIPVEDSAGKPITKASEYYNPMDAIRKNMDIWGNKPGKKISFDVKKVVTSPGSSGFSIEDDPETTRKENVADLVTNLLVTGIGGGAELAALKYGGPIISKALANSPKIAKYATKGLGALSDVITTAESEKLLRNTNSDEMVPRSSAYGQAALNRLIGTGFAKGVQGAAFTIGERNIIKEFLKSPRSKADWEKFLKESAFGDKILEHFGLPEEPGRYANTLSEGLELGENKVGKNMSTEELLNFANEKNYRITSPQITGSAREAYLAQLAKDGQVPGLTSRLNELTNNIDSQFKDLKGRELNETITERGKRFGGIFRKQLNSERAQLSKAESEFFPKVETGKKEFIVMDDLGKPRKTEEMKRWESKNNTFMKNDKAPNPGPPPRNRYETLELDSPIDVSTASSIRTPTINEFKNSTAYSGDLKNALGTLRELKNEYTDAATQKSSPMIELRSVKRKILELDKSINELAGKPGSPYDQFANELIQVKDGLIKDLQNEFGEHSTEFHQILGLNKSINDLERTNVGRALGKGRGDQARFELDRLSGDEKVISILNDPENSREFQILKNKHGKPVMKDLLIGEMIAAGQKEGKLNAEAMKSFQHLHREKFHNVMTPEELKNLDKMTNLLESRDVGLKLSESARNTAEFSNWKEITFVAPWIIPALLTGGGMGGAAAAGATRLGKLGIERHVLGKLMLDSEFASVSNKLINANSPRLKNIYAKEMRDFLIKKGINFAAYSPDEDRTYVPNSDKIKVER